MSAPHNISPSLEKQLVHELEGWIAVGEAVDVFLGGRCSWFAFPVHGNLVNAPDEVRAGSTFWLGHCIIMVGRRQCVGIPRELHVVKVKTSGVWLQDY